ncbi:MAG: cell division protein FtsA [Anaerolineae bacterium]|jgi:cell division protein FtsA|nr:cell division protein FtsA [Anaerolineae bacterium]
MEDTIIVGIDVGTKKVCTLVARAEGRHRYHILGVGIEPAKGLRKGAVVDLGQATRSIRRSIDKAQRTSGMEITAAFVNLADVYAKSTNNRGVVGVSGKMIEQADIDRALEAARAVQLDHNAEIVHVIQRGFTVDGNDGIRTPIGLYGYRMEVEAHIISAEASAVENLSQAVSNNGVQVLNYVLNPLASGEAVLSETERQMGCIICDIGAGTTDIAIYIDGDVWYSKVLPIGGDHITSDIAAGLRLANEDAETLKIDSGFAIKDAINPDEAVLVHAFGQEEPEQVSRQTLCHIIEARTEEIFYMVLQEIKRSGYDGLLPAGMILTGGTSQLPGIQELAHNIMDIPVRIAQPENIYGLADQLHSPAYSGSVGLLHWAMLYLEAEHNRRSGGTKRRERSQESNTQPKNIKDILREILRQLLP